MTDSHQPAISITIESYKEYKIIFDRTLSNSYTKHMNYTRTTPLNRDESIEGEDYRLVMDILLGDEFDQNQFTLELVKHYPKVFVDVCETLGYVNNPVKEVTQQMISGYTVKYGYKGEKIPAIKRYRELTGVSLKEAKNQIDSIVNNLEKPNNT